MISKKLLKKCEKKLIDLKRRYENTLNTSSSPTDGHSDIIDVATREIQIQNSTYFRDRIRKVLPEINLALKRLEEGSYGICEISGEIINKPWQDGLG
jgi:DnaK suppressor protein